MSIRYEDRQRLKDKQIVALDKAMQRAEEITGTLLGSWDIVLREETRPGRGHDIVAWAGDSDYVATQYMDPYGSGPLVVSTIDVIHNDSEEDHFDEYGRCTCSKGAKV